MEQSRRKFIKAFGAGGGMMAISQGVGAEEVERRGETYDPGFISRLTASSPDDLMEAISTSDFQDAVTSVNFEGVDVQAKVFGDDLHGFPLDDGTFVVMSSGEGC